MLLPTTNTTLLAEMQRQLIISEQGSCSRTESDLALRLDELLQQGYEARLFLPEDGYEPPARTGAGGSRTESYGDESQSAGYALFRCGEAEVYLRQFFICENLRSSGLGTRFFTELQQTVFGKRSVELDVFHRNDRVLRFYSRLGFTRLSSRYILPAAAEPTDKQDQTKHIHSSSTAKLPNTISYTTDIVAIRSAEMSGFFHGWLNPLSRERHIQILSNSFTFVAAMDGDRMVGFINAISDTVHFAFIPMLEVIREYQGLGIGTELMKRMIERLEDFPCIDLTCDENLQPFYDRFRMIRARSMVIRRYTHR